MAAKKTGGLGRNFDFILEDNMPIAVQSPRKSKKRTPKQNISIVESKNNDNKRSNESDFKSDERAPDRKSTFVKVAIKATTAKINTEQPEQITIETDTIPQTNSIKPQERALIEKSELNTAKYDSSSRREAVIKLRQKINSTLKDEKIEDTIISDDDDANIDNKDFYSPFVKIKTEKTQKEGNNYVKAEKRTWS